MSKDYSVESIIGIRGYSTPQFSGTGGTIKKQNEDFIVREIPPSGKPIFNGSEIGENLGGLYIHCVLWKTGLDTFSAIKRLSNDLKIPEADFGFAGLKDAAAETFQRISIWNINESRINALNVPKIKLFHPIRQKFAIKTGDLLGNSFEIKIRDIQEIWDNQDWNEFKNHLRSDGVLNFYGPQRFGSKRPLLHLIGKFLLKEEYSKAIERYLGETSPLEYKDITKLREDYSKTSSYRNIRLKFPKLFDIERILLLGLEKKLSPKDLILRLPKSFLRLSVSAYQSYIFNKTLSYLLETDYPLNGDLAIPLPGYESKRKETNEVIWNEMIALLEEDEINLQNFKNNKLNLRSKGILRNALIYPNEFNYSQLDIEKRSVKVDFSLSKGSYATIVIREITKTEC